MRREKVRRWELNYCRSFQANNSCLYGCNTEYDFWITVQPVLLTNILYKQCVKELFCSILEENCITKLLPCNFPQNVLRVLMATAKTKAQNTFTLFTYLPGSSAIAHTLAFHHLKKKLLNQHLSKVEKQF